MENLKETRQNIEKSYFEKCVNQMVDGKNVFGAVMRAESGREVEPGG